MKCLIFSDSHGDVFKMERALNKHPDAEVVFFLGDGLSDADALASFDNKRMWIAVRGNCDTEVDQMVLDFPILADYSYICLDGLQIFATHGHHHNTQNPPSLRKGEILLHGHTHVLKCEEFGNENFYINPGSAALPKENNPRTYMVYESRTFIIKDFDGNIILNKKF